MFLGINVNDTLPVGKKTRFHFVCHDCLSATGARLSKISGQISNYHESTLATFSFYGGSHCGSEVHFINALHRRRRLDVKLSDAYSRKYVP